MVKENEVLDNLKTLDYEILFKNKPLSPNALRKYKENYLRILTNNNIHAEKVLDNLLNNEVNVISISAYNESISIQIFINKEDITFIKYLQAKSGAIFDLNIYKDAFIINFKLYNLYSIEKFNNYVCEYFNKGNSLKDIKNTLDNYLLTQYSDVYKTVSSLYNKYKLDDIKTESEDSFKKVYR